MPRLVIEYWIEMATWSRRSQGAWKPKAAVSSSSLERSVSLGWRKGSTTTLALSAPASGCPVSTAPMGGVKWVGLLPPPPAPPLAPHRIISSSGPARISAARSLEEEGEALDDGVGVGLGELPALHGAQHAALD